MAKLTTLEGLDMSDNYVKYGALAAGGLLLYMLMRNRGMADGTGDIAEERSDDSDMIAYDVHLIPARYNRDDGWYETGWELGRKICTIQIPKKVIKKADEDELYDILLGNEKISKQFDERGKYPKEDGDLYVDDMTENEMIRVESGSSSRPLFNLVPRK